MDFLSIKFFLLLAATILGLRVSKNAKQQNIIVLIASVIFYSLWSIKFLFLLLTECISIYVISIRIINTNKEKQRKVFLVAGIFISVLMLAVFKYYNFFMYSFLHAGSTICGFEVVAPIGISFYTFMIISLIVDIYAGEVDSNIGLLEVLDYCLFFPTIVSGPISKARNIIPQFTSYRRVNIKRIESAVCKFTVGAFKKLVIADRLSIYVDTVFETPKAYSWITLVIASVAYSIQLYCDFAGYSDMAISIAEMMGIEICENFNFPYLSKNPTEFWKRWHISLSAWLQEYLYIPLGGNRKGRIRSYINLILTMLIGGLWHGANWTFILWGGIHGIALVIHKAFLWYTRGRNKASDIIKNKVSDIISIFINFAFVNICWIFFRANSISDAFTIIIRIFTFAKGVDYIYVYTVFFAVSLIIIQIIASKREDNGKGMFSLDLSKFSGKVVLCGTILIILAMGYFGDTAFIYGNF